MTAISESSTDASRDSLASSFRRATISALREGDLGADQDLQRLARLSAQTFAAPMGAIALLDQDSLWFCARHGFAVQEMAIEASPWASVVTSADMDNLIVADAAADERFASGVLVTGPLGMRFYAGVPVLVHGQKIGAIGVMAPVAAIEVHEGAMAALADLARLAGAIFELKEEARVKARMAADLIREEWRHALTLEAGKVGSWVWDLRSGEIVGNEIFRRMFGFDDREALRADDMMAAIDAADIENVNAGLRATFDDGVDYGVEFRVAGTGRWLIGRGRVYQRDAAGKPLVMMGVNIDVTDAREAAEQTRLLLRELNHRVKNTLAMIQSLARQTLRHTPDPQEFIDSFSGRLKTLSDAHSLLSDRDWSGIGLIELLQSQVEPYLVDTPDQLVMVGDDLRLPPDHALGLGLIVHELASNAVKFGALSRPDGRVEVSWLVTGGDGPRLEFTWKETGGPQIFKPAEAGFGTRLIERSLDKVLNSSVKLSFPPQGAEARISLPLG